MLLLATNLSVFALFFGGSFGGWEIVLIVAVILILFGAKKLPGIARGLGEGVSQFRKATKDLDDEAHDAGESLGGIYGKPAAQALTPNNRTAELYDPAAFYNPNDMKRMRFRGLVRLWRLIRIFVSKHLNRKV